MRKLLISFLVTVLFTPILYTSQTHAETITLEATNSDGEYIVGMTYSHDSWNIGYQNIVTGETQLLTSDEATQGYPDIYDKMVVYQQEVLDENGVQVGFDIMLMDLETKETQKVSSTTSHNIYPKISEKYIVWNDYESVVIYNRETGIEKKLTSEDARAFGVQVSGDQVVWMDVRSGEFDIYAQDINSEEEIQITNTETKETSPYISNGTVVWHDYQDGDRKIYSYNLQNKEKEFIGEGTIKDFKNGILLYRNSTSTKVKDLVTGKEANVDPNASELIMIGGKLYTLGSNQQTITLVPNLQAVSTTNESQGQQWLASDDQLLQVYTSDDLSIQKHSLSSTKGIRNTYQVMGNVAYTIEPYSNLPLRFNIAGTDHPLLYQVYGFNTQSQQWVVLESTYQDGFLYFEPQHINSFVLTKYVNPYSDLTYHWAKESVDVLAAKEIISGYPNGEFRPNNNITRAEFLKLVIETLDVKQTDTVSSTFTDIDKHWAKTYIANAYAAGIAKGIGNEFKPDAPITREEMITIIMRAIEQQDILISSPDSAKTITDFRDYQDISSWSQDYMEAAVTYGFITGNGHSLNPKGKSTRAEAAAVLFRIYQSVADPN